MADTVSKLYAEIGFKVNQEGLKQAQRFLTSLHKQMSALNEQTKSVARQYGVFSANQNKQTLADERLATQRERTEVQRNKKRLDNKKFEHKQLMDLAKLELQVEKYNASEQQRIERQQQRDADRFLKERQKRLQKNLASFKSFAIGLRNIFLGVVGIGTASVAGVSKLTQESRQRALNVRDFQFETGIGFNDLQRYRRQFNVIGSRLSPEDIMGDLASIQQNLVDISLGKGNIGGYKLAGVRAAAGEGSALRVVEELRKIAQTQAVDNATLINVMKDMGIKNAGQWLMNFRSVRGDDERTRRAQITAEQEQQILLSEIAVRQFGEALRNAKDQITAKFAPAISDFASRAKMKLEEFSIGLAEGTLDFGNFGKVVVGLKDLLTDLMPAIIGVTKAFIALADTIIGKIWDWGGKFGEKFANFFGADSTPEEERLKAERWTRNIIKYGEKTNFRGIDEHEAFYLFGRSLDEARLFFANYKLMNARAGKDAVSQFNNDRRVNTKNVVNITDNSVKNVTLNANGEDEFVDKVKQVIEEDQKPNKYTQENKFSDINQLWVVGHSAGASMGV